MLQLFPPISHLIRSSWLAFYLSLLTPSILCHDNFVKLLATAQKSLRGFRKLSRRFTMTRLWWECRNNGSSKSKVGETNGNKEISPQMLLSPIWPPKWRMTFEGVLGNSLRTMTCWPEWFMTLSGEPEALKEVGQVVDQMIFLWDEEGAIQDMQGGRSNGGTVLWQF